MAFDWKTPKKLYFRIFINMVHCILSIIKRFYLISNLGKFLWNKWFRSLLIFDDSLVIVIKSELIMKLIPVTLNHFVKSSIRETVFAGYDQNGDFKEFFDILYSSLLHLLPCVGGFWDRTQDSVATLPLNRSYPQGHLENRVKDIARHCLVKQKNYQQMLKLNTSAYKHIMYVLLINMLF